MELRHLRYFATVAQTRHFGRAAERLQMAQPPLSRQIRQLEAELGVELLARTTRQVDLTPAGEVFYADAVRILRSVESAQVHVRRFATGKSGTLRMGFTSSAAYRQLPAIARLVNKFLPTVALEIRTEMLTLAQESALLDSELDVAVLRPPARSAALGLRTIAQESLILAVSEQNPLSSNREVSMAELSAENFIMYPQSSLSVVNDAVVASCLASGFYPQVAYETEKTSTALSLVAAGLGVAVVPESTGSMTLSGVVYLDLLDAESIELALAWRTNDQSPLVARLIELLDENHFFHIPHPTEGSRENL
ncbi:LysR family transcriptional regulator [Cryobacterium sp. Hz9]|nr:LysR family transcriptional regulator [Cryobacterium sp. Hz9]